MTPQSNFMFLASVAAGKTDELRMLLASMNRRPGVVDSQNPLVPFAQLTRLHFARFALLEDATLDDITAYKLPRINYPTYLTFLGDFDGPFDTFLADLVQQAGEGLKRIFLYCDDFASESDLLSWMKSHNVRPATIYVNWIGRTTQQVREEEALRQAMVKFIQENAASLWIMPSRQVYDKLTKFVKGEQHAGQIKLTPPEPTPFGWRVRNFLDLVGVPLILLALSPVLLLFLPFFLLQLRRREKSDPEITPRIDPVHARQLADLEDHDITNQFSAMGSVKPGLFRRWALTFFLWVVNYTTQHIYNRARLARVTTIHFARWVFLDGKKRLLFASNYDGSLESYMDDFINKVAFGLNLVFSNGIGYPRTNWLILDGAKDEQKFKYYIRRHELATEVWYNAFPGLSNLDMQRNTLIRQGLDHPYMTDGELQQWLQMF
jgi:hypothetical protein